MSDEPKSSPINGRLWRLDLVYSLLLLVAAVAAVELVIAFVSEQHVMADIAEDRVVAGTTVEDIIATYSHEFLAGVDQRQAFPHPGNHALFLQQFLEFPGVNMTKWLNFFTALAQPDGEPVRNGQIRQTPRGARREAQASHARPQRNPRTDKRLTRLPRRLLRRRQKIQASPIAPQLRALPRNERLRVLASTEDVVEDCAESGRTGRSCSRKPWGTFPTCPTCLSTGTSRPYRCLRA